MNTSITARELFEQQRERLGLRWAAGKSGEKRELEAGNTVSRRPSLAGYLNAIYPNKVQILGTEELSWLDALEPRQRWETIEKIMQSHPLALVLTATSPARKTCARPPMNPARRCGCRPSAATSCSTTCPTTWRVRWRRG